MRRYVWRQMLARPGRALLTMASIVVGVAAVVASMAATGATRAAYRQTYTSLAGRAALEVVGRGGTPLEPAIAAELKQVSGVADVVPVLQQPTVLYVGHERLKRILVGVAGEQVSAGYDYKIEAGRLPAAPDETALEAHFARGAGLKIGDSLRLLARRGVKRLRVVGLVAPRNPATLNPATALFMDLKDAQALFGRQRQVDALQLMLDDDASAKTVAAELAARFEDEFDVRSPAARQDLPDVTLRGAELGLTFASALMLEVAAIIVLHAFFMNVGERRRQLAILRLIGATRKQIIRALVYEGLVLGAAGSLLGLGIGLAAAHLLANAMQQMFQSSLPAVGGGLPAIMGGLMTGPGLAVIGTWLPAYRASRIAPLEAARALESGTITGRTRRAAAFAIVLTIVAFILQLAAAAGWLPVLAIIPGGAAALLACCFVLFACLRPMVTVAVRVADRLLGIEASLGCEYLLRRPGRSGLTIGVLFVAVATGIGIANTLLNDLHDARGWFRRTMVADYFVRATFPDPTSGLAAAMSDAVGEELARIPGVAAVEPIRFITAKVNGRAVVVIARDMQNPHVRLNLVDGDGTGVRRQMQRGEAVIGTALAERLHVGAGEFLTLATKSGAQQIRVAGIVNDYLAGGLIVGLDWPTARRLLAADGSDVFFVQKSPSASANLTARLQRFCNEHGLTLDSYAEFSGTFDKMMVGVLGSLWVLVLLALIVAVFGIVNTLAMNVLEQTREIGLLRITGMTRRQVIKTIVVQAAAMGLMGLVPGAAAGIGTAYVINACMLAMLGHHVEFAVRPLLLLAAIAAGMFMVVVAAIGPARRAARLALVEAIRYE